MQVRLLKIPQPRCSKTFCRLYAAKSQPTFYEVLEITPRATSNEIKAAYYRLSMKYHPDRASEAFIRRFHEITTAYDTLSNESLRSKYDEETFGVSNAFSPRAKTTGFSGAQYRAAASRPIMRGRTPIYNFDEFYKQHYGDAVKSYQERKAKYDAAMKEMDEPQINRSIYGVFMILLVLVMTTQKFWTTKHDVPSPPDDSNGKSQ